MERQGSCSFAEQWLLKGVSHYRMGSCNIIIHINDILDTKNQMIPIALAECHVWSDGEDDHEEDHNIYYDLKYFVVFERPGFILTYAWKVYDRDDHTSGMLFEMSRLDEYGTVYKSAGSMPVSDAVPCLRKELLNRQNEKYRCYVVDFIHKNSQST